MCIRDRKEIYFIFTMIRVGMIWPVRWGAHTIKMHLHNICVTSGNMQLLDLFLTHSVSVSGWINFTTRVLANASRSPVRAFFNSHILFSCQHSAVHILLRWLHESKVLPNPLLSIGPRTDPGVQAVSPQVIWSDSCHKPGAVTFHQA